ncbi:hypothetical protein BCR33DRAFT_762691 [Rhizoclosmatium globosum]|uniref:Tetraspannin-domain-containing protein n=1 Tax=Rhizoclosmatium globosum TaxID=329046 RepID=A0A1Y2CU01_9FUNG|nr:hypothetical protein BCR33DRAFT_762691 [Rhizoclosmatium globosum]|eukprot:ORY50314.1 hypothetical protein BCR33DRAFT_762691 [Rhizoclosmatium globosum]
MGRPPSVPSIIHRKSQILCAGMGRLQLSLFVLNVLYTTLALAAFITTILTYNDILPASAVFKAAFPSLWALIASTTFLLLPSGPLTFFSLFASSKRAYSVTLAFSTIALVLVLATSITSYTFSKDSQVSSTLSDGWTVWNESGLRAMVEEKWSCCGYTDYSDRPGSDACVALGSGSNSSVTGSLDDPLSTDGLESIAATLVSQYQSAGTTSSASPSVKTNIASRSSAVASSVALTEALETSDWTVTEYEDSTESVMESNGAEAVFSTESVLPDTSPKVSTKPLPIIKTATNPQSLRVAQPIPQQRDFETTVQVKLTNQGCQDPLKSYIIKVLDRVYIAGFSFLALSCLHIVAMVAVQLDSGM